MTVEMAGQFFIEFSSMKFHNNLSRGSGVYKHDQPYTVCVHIMHIMMWTHYRCVTVAGSYIYIFSLSLSMAGNKMSLLLIRADFRLPDLT